MKVTSGKLQIGDKIHWMDGGTEIVDQKMVDIVETGNDIGHGVEFMLRAPTEVKKITRKAKERELGPDEILVAGDIVRFADGHEMTVEEGKYLAGAMQGFGTLKRVFRPLSPARISRREYKRRVEAALARIDGRNASGLPILEELRQILEGKR